MNYLIVYNHTQSTFDTSQIHRTITEMEGTIDWWHYLPNVYIIVTEKDEKFIADKIISKHPGLLFFTTNVNLSKNNGVLNKDAWEWIRKKTGNLIKLKVAPQPPRDLLSEILRINPPLKPGPMNNFESARKALDEILRGKK